MSGKLVHIFVVFVLTALASCKSQGQNAGVFILDPLCSLTLDPERSVLIRQSGTRKYFSHADRNDFFVDTAEGVAKFQELLERKGLKAEIIDGTIQVRRYSTEGTRFSSPYVIWIAIGSGQGIVFNEHDAESVASFGSLMGECIDSHKTGDLAPESRTPVQAGLSNQLCNRSCS